MIYEEDDINFDILSGKDFEEMCVDLLLKLGFHPVIWRQGGADDGRDIEATFSITNPLVESYTEKWFIECKRHSKGVNPKSLDSKIAWANSEKPDHFVVIVSSYISGGGRRWVENVTSDRPHYRVHCIEGKQLKQLILNFPEIVAKYFGNESSRLLKVLKEAWQSNGITPAPENFWLLYKKLNPIKLSTEDLVFIWCTSKKKEEEIKDWCSSSSDFIDSGDKAFSFDYLLNYLWEKSDEAVQPLVLSEADYFPNAVGLHERYKNSKTVTSVSPLVMYSEEFIYSYSYIKNMGSLEILMKRGRKFPIVLQHFDNNKP